MPISIITENLQVTADKAREEKFCLALKNIAEYHRENHISLWRAFYENTPKIKVYLGSFMGYVPQLEPYMFEIMQKVMDAGLAPTPEQVGARSPFMAWAHRLIGQTGEARQALMAAWSASLGERIEAAYARLNKRR